MSVQGVSSVSGTPFSFVRIAQRRVSADRHRAGRDHQRRIAGPAVRDRGVEPPVGADQVESGLAGVVRAGDGDGVRRRIDRDGWREIAGGERRGSEEQACDRDSCLTSNHPHDILARHERRIWPGQFYGMKRINLDIKAWLIAVVCRVTLRRRLLLGF